MRFNGIGFPMIPSHIYKSNVEFLIVKTYFDFAKQDWIGSLDFPNSVSVANLEYFSIVNYACSILFAAKNFVCSLQNSNL